MIKVLGVAALLALCLARCSHPLAPDYQLTDTRILAMRSEPTSLVPASSVLLDALLYVPSGAPAPSYSWTWCPKLGTASDNFACTIDASTLQTALDPDGSLGITIDYSLGTAATATFAYPVDASTLQSLCAGGTTGGASSGSSSGSSASSGGSSSGSSSSSSSSSGGGSSGGSSTKLNCLNRNSTLPISIVLTVTAGKNEIRAYRSLDLLFAADSSGDTNPTIDAISLTAAGSSTAATRLTPATSYALFSDLPLSASETSTILLPDGSTLTSLEGLTLDWFVSAGTLSNASTVLAPAQAPDTRTWSNAETNTWVAPKGTPKGTTDESVEFVVVVRDTRNGVGWLTQSLDLSGGR